MMISQIPTDHVIRLVSDAARDVDVNNVLA